MKKLVLIALALLTVFTCLGVGFAMWSQTVTVTGNVNTGNVSLAVSNYTGTWAWKDINSGALEFLQGGGWAGNQMQATVSPNLLVGYAEVESVNGVAPTSAPVICTSNGGIQMVLKYWNLFPVPVSIPATPSTVFRTWQADFDITNAGSIPIKFETGRFPASDPQLSPGDNSMLIDYYGYTADNPRFDLDGYQLEPCGSIHVIVTISVDENTTQSYNGSFTLTITGVQWNEYEDKR